MEARIDGVATGGRAERNAWVIGDNQEVIVVDPGEDAGAVLGVAGDREILAGGCTHGHAAHAGAALEAAERDEAPVALHPRDRLVSRGGPGDPPAPRETADRGSFEAAGR